jgi:hypothetical protein
MYPNLKRWPDAMAAPPAVHCSRAVLAEKQRNGAITDATQFAVR